MTVDTLKVLTKRVQIRSWILLAFLAAYVAITVIILFQAVIPSYVKGTTSDMFAVDSTVYVNMADSIRQGRNDPFILEALSTFPNTFLAPVGISLILNSAFLVMLANYSIFALSILLLKKSFSISLGIFLPLLLLNPITTTSLLCVNKEILDLLVMSLFLYSRARRHTGLLLVALGLALLNRYEFCIVLLIFIIAESRLNPWRERRLATLLFLVIALNFAIPRLETNILATRLEEAQSAGLIKFLDTMQNHYLYVLAVAPKIMGNLIGAITNPLVWTAPSSYFYIMFFNSVAYVIVLFIAATNRLLTLRNDFVYISALGSVLVATSPVLQPRYFNFIYVLLCLLVAQTAARKSTPTIRLCKQDGVDSYAPSSNHKEAALG